MRLTRSLAVALAGCLAAGCTRSPTPPPAAADPAPPTVDDEARSALSRTQAELAESRAQVEELRRLLEDRAAAPAPPPKPDPTPAPGGFTVLARERVHDGPVTALAFAPGGRTLATADTLGRVVLSDAPELRLVRAVEAVTGEGVHNPLYALAFDPDGKHLAAGSEDRTVWIWRTEDGKPVKRVRGHQDAVEHVFFLANGKGGLSFDRQGVGVAWTVAGEKRELIPDRRLRRAAVTPDGGLLVWSDGSRTVCGPPEEADPTADLGAFADALAVTADGSLVAKGAGSYAVELWDVQYKARKWSGPALPGKIHSLTFTPDGKRLISLTAGAMSVWDVRTGDELGRYRLRPEEGACKLAVAGDGKTVALGGRRGTVTVARLPD